MSDTYLLVWSIGPVQDFIAAGRKGRDLWFGSWLLSELARSAALTVPHADLIHPYDPKPENLKNTYFNVSNKLLVQTTDPRATAEKLEQAARAYLYDLATSVLEQHKDVLQWDTAIAQIKDLPEFYWAAASLAGGFAQARKTAEALHAGAKAHRQFQQPPWEAGVGVPKSSLDSSRESVIHEAFYDKKKDILKRFSIQGNERLCGVSLLKRLGHNQAEGRRGWVMSTSHVASWTMRQSWSKDKNLPVMMIEELIDARAQYENVLKKCDADLTTAPRMDPVLDRLDGHVLFENRLSDLVDERFMREAQEAHAHFMRSITATFKKYQQPVPKKPTPYYAILVADGDRIGAAIDKLSEGKNAKDSLQRFTVELEGFAQRARATVSRHHGHAIYAGGDDVMAILPLELVFSCANELREDFATTMKPIVKGLLPEDVYPTLSVGMGIGHHTSPLQGVLNHARTAEQMAKQKYGRNAWCIILDKRSGSPLETGGKWDAFTDFDSLYNLYRQEKLPRGLAYDLRTAGQRLTLSKQEEEGGEKSEKRGGKEEKVNPLKDAFQAMRAAEACRIFVQKKIVEEAAEILLKQCAKGDLEQVANRLQMARFLTDPEEER